MRPGRSCWTSRISFSVAQTTATCSFEESQHVEIARSMRSYFSESKESEVLHRVCRVLTIACVLVVGTCSPVVSFCSSFAFCVDGLRLRQSCACFFLSGWNFVVADPQSHKHFHVSSVKVSACAKDCRVATIADSIGGMVENVRANGLARSLFEGCPTRSENADVTFVGANQNSAIVFLTDGQRFVLLVAPMS